MKNDFYPPTLLIKNAGLLDSWALAVNTIINEGMIIQGEPDRPNTNPPLTRDACLTIEYTSKGIEEIFRKCLHPQYPQQNGLQEYINQYYMDSPEYYHANVSDQQFDYTYTKRFRRAECLCEDYENGTCKGISGKFTCKYYNNGEFTDGYCFVDQLKYIAEHLEPFNRRMQAITWDVEKDLQTDLSVPCLQRLQLRNLGNGFYEIFFDWRSRDLMKAYLWNIIALVNSIDDLIQETRERLGQSKLKLIKITDRITAAHIYEPEWALANKISVPAETIAKCIYI